MHPDGSVDVLDERLGFADDVDGFVDGVRLLSARVTASVPMNDGTTLSTDLRWDMAGTAFNVAGTDGPIQEEVAPWAATSSTAASPRTGTHTRPIGVRV